MIRGKNITLEGRKVRVIEFRDITERKQAEALQRKEDLKYRLLADYTFAWEYWLTPEGEYNYMSPSCERISGYRPDEFISNPQLIFDIVTPEYAEAVHQHLTAENNREAPTHTEEFKIMTKGGEERWLEHNCTPVFDENGGYAGRRGSNRDITERKQAEEETQKSQERFKKLSSLTFEGIMIHDKGVTIDVNESFTKLFGYAKDELLGKNLLDLIFPSESIPVVNENMIKYVATPYEVVGRKKDGTLFPVEIEGRDMSDANGYFRVAAFRDISSRKQAEIALLESEKHLRLVFENAPVALFQEDFSEVKVQIELLKHEGVNDFQTYLESHPEIVEKCATKVKIIDVNRAALRLHNANTTKELLEGLNKTFTEESYKVFCNELAALANGSDSFNTEATVQTLDGEKREVLLQLFIDPNRANWSCVYVSLTDITDRKKTEAEHLNLETQLRQKYKMEAVGVMAGGMAHNFNNNLSIILGSIELSKRKMQPNPEVDNYLNNAKIAALRSSDLVKQILTYSRQGAKSKTPIQLTLIIDETLKLLHSTIPTTINLQQRISSDSYALMINADSSQIQECLINLCNNATYAMDPLNTRANPGTMPSSAYKTPAVGCQQKPLIKSSTSSSLPNRSIKEPGSDSQPSKGLSPNMVG